MPTSNAVTARSALIAAGKALRLRGVSRVVLNTRGSNWTDLYEVFVYAHDTPMCEISVPVPGADADQPTTTRQIKLPVLPHEARTVVSEALGDLTLPEGRTVSIHPGSVFTMGTLIWPPEAIIENLEAELELVRKCIEPEIADLRAQIARAAAEDR